MAKVNLNWKFPLRKGKKGMFEFNITIEDAIKEDVKNLLFTRRGERIVHKDYGTDILLYLFEQKTSELKAKIVNEVKGSIQRWVRGVKVTRVDVLFDDDITPQSKYFAKVQLDENSAMVIVYYDITSADQNFIVPQQNIAVILKNG